MLTRVAATVALIAATTIPAVGQAIYKDADQPIDARVADLLSQMTLSEKAAQLTCLWDSKPQIQDEEGWFAPEKASAFIPDGIGCLARPSDHWGLEDAEHRYRAPEETARLTMAYQRWAIESTRLGIPILMHEEGLHGLMSRHGTHFPQAIALAGMFDTELTEEIYTIVSREIRALGVHHVLSPVVDVARDARWGRIEETYGEDPYLVGRVGVAAVKGFQGEDGFPIANDRVLATLKHMTGHGQPESGTNIGPAQISERTLRENFFPPFEMAIRDANAQSVMASYNEIDGIPSHANQWLLGDVLRGEWGFSGVVVADYYAIPELQRRHSVASDKADAAMQALSAGVDLELPDWDVYKEIPALVEAGTLDMAVVDKAVERVLTFKFRAGLFDAPYADPAHAKALIGNEEARGVALAAARKSIVLLKNEGDLLPLTPGAHKRIAVIGPNARDLILGGYSDEPLHSVSMVDGIRALIGDQAEVVYSEGARITDTRGWWNDTVTLPDPYEDRARVAQAVVTAKQSDVAIVVIGDNEQTSREAWAEIHLGDRTSLELVGLQEEMVKQIVATGTPTIVVMNHGRPLAINWISENVPAILDTWYLGQETGTAVAEALFGEINPGAKLAVTIPRSVGQLPMFYNYKPTAHRGYLFDEATPLYPFGYGLSYTTFSFQNLRLADATIGLDGTATVMVDVTNTGDRAGDEVVQLYIRDDLSSVTRPVKELKGFERITLAPGETKTVSLTLTSEHLSFFDRSMERVVEPGTFTIMVGPSSADVQSVTLTVED